MVMQKIKEGDPSITDNEALNYALFAKNVETNHKGFSASQIVYGNNPTLPGILNSTPASLENEYTNEDVKKHMLRTTLARIAFLQADTDDRLKKAVKARINSHENEFFEQGDMVSFKEDDKIKQDQGLRG